MVPGPASSSLTWKLLETQIPKPLPISPEPETLGVEVKPTSLSGDFDASSSLKLLFYGPKDSF